ncbi:MAG: hypothetical protein O7G88_10665 [bacterium]|nr:hypothetical protein [bacterium]
MLPWHCVNIALQRLATLVLLASIALLGCDNSSDNVTAQDVANRTFTFDSSFIDTDLDGLTTILAFGVPVDENSAPFNLTLRDEVPDPNEITLSGTAAIKSIELPIGIIEIRQVILPDPIVFDVNVDDEDDGTLVFIFTNDNGNQLRFEFEEGEMSADAAPIPF